MSNAKTIQLSQLLAQEFRRPGVKIRVNNIAPGIFPSEMTSTYCFVMSECCVADHSDTAGESDETNKSGMEVGPDYGEKKGIPAGRPGRDEDMAQLALFLACNEYAYGQVSLADSVSYRGLLSTGCAFVDGGH